MATPQVPRRPLRSKSSSEQTQAPGGTLQLPVAPRQTGRVADRVDSNGQDSFAPSPLNDPPFLPRTGNVGTPYGSQGPNASSSNSNLPARPPSVTLPSIGQEGNEYADIVNMEQEQPLSKTGPATQETTTSHVGTDLPLHAPKPSLSQSDQRARVQGVTRTDPDKASLPNTGRQISLHGEDPMRGLKSKSSIGLRSPSVASTERPESAQAEEHGIPEIGIQVPMYPNAGDVQAPSPAMHGAAHPPPSAGFHSDRPRHHGRTRSGREVFYGPPGSYGLRGHGVASTDKFERAWYEKHPEALAQEGQYSPALNNIRGDYVLSSEDLNKLVQDTAKRGAGFGTAANIVGLPDEQIGYMASEEYATRIASRPSSSYASKAQAHVDSPLRKASSPADVMNKAGLVVHGAPELPQPVTSDQDQSEVIHIDAPEQKFNKVTGGAPSTPPVDLGPRGGNTEHEGGFIDDQGYGVPILASDEIRPGSVWQRPAVSPLPEERRASLHDLASRFGSRPDSAPGSRPASRPGSVHVHHGGLSRYTSHEDYEIHTPLDDVEEYEPLFEDDEKAPKKPPTQSERLRYRPDMRRRFPSQDIWEDTPNSLQLQAEIESPSPLEQPAQEKQSFVAFEHPETEAARKGEVGELEKAKLMPKEKRLERSNFKQHLRDDNQRPGMVHRFPSQDIWEDSPDSARLETTVGGETAEEDAGIAAGAVVQTSALSAGLSREGATTGASVQPSTTTGGSLAQAATISVQGQDTSSKGDSASGGATGAPGPDRGLLAQRSAALSDQQAHKPAVDGASTPASSSTDQKSQEGTGADTTPPIPPRPSRNKAVSPSQAAQPPIPARPHRLLHHHHHAASPQEHSRLSEVFTAPSEETKGSPPTDSQPSASKGQGLSLTEGQKAPTVPTMPHRPEQHGESRASKVEPSSPEEVAGATTSSSVVSHSTITRPQGASTDSMADTDVSMQGASGVSSSVSKHDASPPYAAGVTVGTQASDAENAGTIVHGALDPASRDPTSSKSTTAVTGAANVPDVARSQAVGVSGANAEFAGMIDPSRAAATGLPSTADIKPGSAGVEVGTRITGDIPVLSEAEVPGSTDEAVFHSPASKHRDAASFGMPSSLSGDIGADGGSHALKGVVSPPAMNKVKPAVPARPGGSKIAALQAGFMSDLNNRLKLGPQVPQKPTSSAEEEKVEEDKAPLADARKARAKGPARRKPAGSPGRSAVSAASSEDTTTASGVGPGANAPRPTSSLLTTFQPICLWQVHNTGAFDTVRADSIEKAHHPPAGDANAVGSLDGGNEGIASTPLPKLGNEPPVGEADLGFSTESSVQTGENDITVHPSSPEQKKLRVTEGGNATTGENVVVPQEEAEAEGTRLAGDT